MISDYIPPCPAGSQHPYSDLKRGMAVVHEQNDQVIFGCLACLEVHRTQQVIVRTLPKGWQRAAHLNRQRIQEQAARFEKLRHPKSGRLTIHPAEPDSYA